jgi:hypothetical protein
MAWPSASAGASAGWSTRRELVPGCGGRLGGWLGWYVFGLFAGVGGRVLRPLGSLGWDVDPHGGRWVLERACG